MSPDTPVKEINRRIWILLTSVFTFLAGIAASQGDWNLCLAMVAVWIFSGSVIIACRPGEKRT